MLFPGDLTVALVTKLQSIAEVTGLLGGDAKRVFPYRRKFPDQTTLMQAIWRAPIPSLMVVWEGTYPGNFGRNEVWKHRFGVYVRFAETVQADASDGAYKLWYWMVNGVPTDPGADGLKMLRTTIHPLCYPMDSPSIVPQMGNTEDSKGPFEFFKAQIVLTEKGDS